MKPQAQGDLPQQRIRWGGEVNGQAYVLLPRHRYRPSSNIACCRGDPCGRPVYAPRAPDRTKRSVASAGDRATTRVALHHGGPTPSDRLKRAANPFHSGINANVHSEPPVGTLSCTKRGATAPPNPDATDTYCRPLWVYVMAVELTLELTLNCHSVLPLSASRARNSPVSLPVNMSPPSVANMPAALGASANGASHFFSPVTGLTATKAPTTSPGLNVGLRATTPVDTVPRACGFDGASLCIRWTFQVF